ARGARGRAPDHDRDEAEVDAFADRNIGALLREPPERARAARRGTRPDVAHERAIRAVEILDGERRTEVEDGMAPRDRAAVDAEIALLGPADGQRPLGGQGEHGDRVAGHYRELEAPVGQGYTIHGRHYTAILGIHHYMMQESHCDFTETFRVGAAL